MTRLGLEQLNAIASSRYGAMHAGCYTRKPIGSWWGLFFYGLPLTRLARRSGRA